MRLGIFGGSFDPVHNGHLALARACQQQAALDEVWFVPTAIQPLKHHGPKASNADRVEMLRLAVEDQPLWRVCTVEVDRGGPSYTVDTLRRLREELPDAQLFFMIGSDAQRDIPRWKEPDVIFSLATPLIVHRAGEAEPNLQALSLLCTTQTQPQIVEMQPAEISSTEVRSRIADGRPLNQLVPARVLAYIASKNLYR